MLELDLPVDNVPIIIRVRSFKDGNYFLHISFVWGLTPVSRDLFIMCAY